MAPAASLGGKPPKVAGRPTASAPSTARKGKQPAGQPGPDGQDGIIVVEGEMGLPPSQDMGLRDLHDPIEGDSADISWRGNVEVKRHAGVEAKQHDQAGDNPRDFDPDKVLKDIDEAVHKMAGHATHTAKELSSKLLGGANDATSSITKLAGSVTHWWAHLDPGVPKSQPASGSNTRGAASPEQDSQLLQEEFGLATSEELLEQFPCSMLQTYTCLHNPFTPNQQVSFPGTLYITDAHTCFSSCTKDGQEVIVIVSHKETARAAKAKPIRKGASASLKLEFGDKQWVVFDEFASGELDLLTQMQLLLGLIALDARLSVCLLYNP
eukprot:jgi/Astpho2/3007/Aster-03316